MSGPECCENPPNYLSGEGGAGHVQQLGGFNCYISGPADYTQAVILVSDIFGYEAPKLRKLADKVAAAGFYVVVPDFLRGDPHVANDERPLEVWIIDHGPDQGFEDAKPVIEALKSKGVTKIGAAGFCWGAKVVVELAKYAYIQAAVLLHPSFVALDDMHAVKVPISILGAEIDRRSPPELVKQFEMALNAKPEVDAFVKIFPGVSHGWSVRYNDEDEFAVKSAEESHQDMLGWFEKHVK
ncbi:endo-1,3;1,4-beta-D-glucanase-like [Solanum dulcamara]|uniref:endo-1,3;1,4-beta-D-glucanase-like n=1 Tax=Solanum dulcamara TaxID=45834 RepID=UPI002485B79D|nr:endo-1,3;1,4-beta-D-glucanase-like [Solanum dulcamara]